MSLPIRKGGKSGGGGYLNGVSGTIVRIGFKAGKKGTGDKGPWAAYSGVFEFQPDGAEKIAVQFLNAGFLRGDLSISDDGNSIEGKDRYILDDSQFGDLINSLAEGDGLRLSEETLGDLRNYDSVAGTRATLSRVYDVEATKQAGLSALLKAAKTPVAKKKLQDEFKDEANAEKFITAGKRKDRNDPKKTYMLDKLLIAEVLALPEVKAAGKKATGAKATAAKPAAAAKAAPKAEPTEDSSDDNGVDIAKADGILKAIVGSADNFEVKAISNAVVRHWMSKANNLPPAEREPYRTTLIDSDYLKGADERGVIVLSEDGKTVAAAA